MIKKIKQIIWNFLIKMKLGGSIQLFLASGLKEDGWFETFNSKNSIDKNGNPIPWCTYPFIKFIEPRLKKNFSIFEFGSGNSTLWFSSRVRNIIAVENDKEWFNIISSKLPSNAQIIFKELDYDGEYCRSAVQNNIKFNIIIIDGRDRVNCVKHSIESLTDNGVIFFDNSDLSQYQEGIKFLIANGFKKLDFIGLSPITPHNNCTSIFYKQVNCLGI